LPLGDDFTMNPELGLVLGFAERPGEERDFGTHFREDARIEAVEGNLNHHGALGTIGSGDNGVYATGETGVRQGIELDFTCLAHVDPWQERFGDIGLHHQGCKIRHGYHGCFGVEG